MRSVATVLALVSLVAFGAFVRIATALRHPDFDRHAVEGMLRSDPALLYYLTQRVIEAGGLPPEDYRADPRIEHPDLTDVPATFAVGQEFVIAWLYRAFGSGVPLHVFCVQVMGVFASLAMIGVVGLAFELTRRRRWALAAGVLFALLPANYRTIGFVLVREDFSLPWFALHLWLLARAVRVRSLASIVLAAASFAAAAATWHASGFLLALEMLCIFAGFVRTGRNPLAPTRAGMALLVLALACLSIPLLWSKLFVLSLPMQLALALWVAGRASGRIASLAAAVGAWAGLAALHGALSPGDYAHVFELLWSKIVWLGQLPDDPALLSFDARLMWQGPFATLPFARLHGDLLVGLWLSAPLLVAAIPGWVRGGCDDRVRVLAALCAAGLLAAWLIDRLRIVPGLLCPVAAVVFLAGLPPRIAALVLAAGLVIQGFSLQRALAEYEPWNAQAWVREELAEVVGAVRRLVPDGEAIAADFMTSPAILAHTGHPIVLQPKWETARSRERAREFLTAFVHGTPEGLAALVAGKYRCRYLLLDRRVLWGLCHYIAGIPSGGERRPGTAAAVFCADDEATLAGVPGYRLLYHSYLYRLYRLE